GNPCGRPAHVGYCCGNRRRGKIRWRQAQARCFMSPMRDTPRHLSIAQPRHGDNAPQPIRSLRDWIDHLAACDRLAVIKPNVDLRFELAAYAKRLDGQRATLFPRAGGHPIPVVSGLVSDRSWMAEAMGVEPDEVLSRFQDAALNPIPWRELASA